MVFLEKAKVREEFGVRSSEFGVQSSEFRVQSSEFGVQSQPSTFFNPQQVAYNDEFTFSFPG